MFRNARISFYLIPLLVFCAAPVFAAQVPSEASPAEALKARVVLYYGTLQKGQKTAALDLVAPESKNGFGYMNYDGLVDFRILEVRLSDSGDTATVRLLRRDNFPGFPQVLRHETVDTWRRIDGQWYVLLPIPKENAVLETPFGKMTFNRRGENQQQATPPLPSQGPQNMVSPEEAKKALQKAMQEANKQKSGDQEKKPEDKQQAAPPLPSQGPQNMVSPEEAKKALQKAMEEANKQKPGDQEKKPVDKKSEDQSVAKPNPQN